MDEQHQFIFGVVPILVIWCLGTSLIMIKYAFSPDKEGDKLDYFIGGFFFLILAMGEAFVLLGSIDNLLDGHR